MENKKNSSELAHPNESCRGDENYYNKWLGLFIFLYICTTAITTYIILVPFAALTQICDKLPPWARRLSFQFCSFISGVFCSSTIGFVELLSGTQFITYGDIPEDSKEGALIICNHPSQADWLYLWSWFCKYQHIPNLRIVMKDEIRYMPFFGWSVQCCIYLFLTRTWSQDKDHITDLVSYWRAHAPKKQLSLLIFPEGTNLGPHAIPGKEKFLAKSNMPPMTYVLPPRVTGFSALFFDMTGLSRRIDPNTNTLNLDGYNLEESDVNAVYDFTMAYTRTGEHNRVTMFNGWFPYTIHTHMNRIPILDLITDFTLSHSPSRALTQTPSEDSLTIENKSEGEGDMEMKQRHSNTDKDTDFTHLYKSDSEEHSSDCGCADSLAVDAPPALCLGRHKHTLNTPSLPSQVQVTQVEERLGLWLNRVFYAKDRMLTRFYTDPRMEDALTPPLLHSSLILPFVPTNTNTNINTDPSSPLSFSSPHHSDPHNNPLHADVHAHNDIDLHNTYGKKSGKKSGKNRKSVREVMAHVSLWDRLFHPLMRLQTSAVAFMSVLTCSLVHYLTALSLPLWIYVILVSFAGFYFLSFKKISVPKKAIEAFKANKEVYEKMFHDR